MILPEMNTNKRIWLGILLVTVIIAMAIYLALNWKSAFSKTKIITYPDGCKERYINNNLMTPECTKGRLLAQQQQITNTNQQWYNFTSIAVGNTT